MIEAYEAQRDRYQRYQIAGGAWQHDGNMSQLDLPSHPPPHNSGFSRTSSLHASCNACHGLLDTDGSCEQCISLDTLLLYTQGATPHVISMQAYDMGAGLIDLDSDTDYTITETPPDHALYMESIGEWECNCTSPTSHRQIFLSTEGGRPLNLLV